MDDQMILAVWSWGAFAVGAIVGAATLAGVLVALLVMAGGQIEAEREAADRIDYPITGTGRGIITADGVAANPGSGQIWTASGPLTYAKPAVRPLPLVSVGPGGIAGEYARNIYPEQLGPCRHAASGGETVDRTA